MSRNRFYQILRYLRFSNNENVPDNVGLLFKVQKIIDYFSERLKNMYKPSQNISLDEGMIPWCGRLNFHVYNPSKLTKYGIVIRMVCELVSGYISKFKIYSGPGISLQDSISHLTSDNKYKWHHLYMDDFYNSVEIAKKIYMKKK